MRALISFNRILSFAVHSNGAWVRRGKYGPGLRLTNQPPLFSERYGYVKCITNLGKWRFVTLPSREPLIRCALCGENVLNVPDGCELRECPMQECNQ